MKTLTAALMMSATLLTAGAQAADNFEPNNTPFQGVYGQDDSSAASRAQVQAELSQARSQGLTSNVEPNNQPYQGVYASAESIGKTRAQVKAELADAKARGLVSNVEPNDVPFQGVYGAPAPSQLASGE
ncbi:DUF4148 domain-containing protein [Bordetella genomosp. 13]|uniref:DUF4148 domain-containing protein n=1 Tax=Bordetella genomosp. 13 TaxID=463040 RepID=A0A1W6Z9A0_9BORD|nr:DUF4148 domain-containing protein [Bordetella genomosp. 13]ARP93909.1 hypothetical protein CAL15_05615 [Bordetella genomosp. 13]